jgi:hypothetical protein
VLDGLLGQFLLVVPLRGDEVKSSPLLVSMGSVEFVE